MSDTTRTLDMEQFGFEDIELQEGELVDGAILIVRTHLDNDRSGLATRVTEHLDWLTRRGMLDEAIHLDRRLTAVAQDQDEDYGD